MHHTNEGNVPRLRVVEVVSSPKQQKHAQNSSQFHGRRNKKRLHNPDLEEHDQENIVKYAMEMKPVLDAVLAYGRKTHGLGALKGSQALVTLIDKIRTLTKQDSPITPACLDQIIKEAEEASTSLKTMFVQAYEEG